MKIGVPKEIKSDEYRVGLTPDAVRELVDHGHDVVVETQCGSGIGFNDKDYQLSGAKVLSHAEDVFDNAQLIIKVKEPQPNECKMLTKSHTLFTFLHLAADKRQAELLMASQCLAIAYETVTDPVGRLPLLSPMSQVAGRFSIQAGAHYLEKPQGGRGVLLGGVPGVAKGNVLIFGGGVVGRHAAIMAMGKGANVTIVDKNIDRLAELSDVFSDRVNTMFANNANKDRLLANADLVVGAVLVPGDSAPKLVTRDDLTKMKKGSVLVDVAIDQGGCFETSKPTTHTDPTYVVDDIVHYCVANMPGAVPHTSTYALNNVTLPYILKIANQGTHHALANDPHLLMGLNVCRGEITHPGVAKALGYEYVNPDQLLV